MILKTLVACPACQVQKNMCHNVALRFLCRVFSVRSVLSLAWCIVPMQIYFCVTLSRSSVHFPRAVCAKVTNPPNYELRPTPCSCTALRPYRSASVCIKCVSAAVTSVALLTLCPEWEFLQATPIARTQDGGDNKLMFFGSIAAAIMGNLEVVEAGACSTGGTLIEHMQLVCMYARLPLLFCTDDLLLQPLVSVALL